MSRRRPLVTIVRFLHVALSRAFPYVPPHIEIPSERAGSFVATEVRTSSIPGAGLGLFALEDIGAGVTVGEYCGDRIGSHLQFMRVADWSYVCQTADPRVHIDARSHAECLMRYICHDSVPERRNVDFLFKGEQAFYQTTRPVVAGEELLTNYGEEFWMYFDIVPRSSADAG